jgi:acyl-CoA synthetase (NDP forming)
MSHTVQALQPFFEPRRVAVIGASRTPGKGGYNIIENLQRLGFAGAVYPVNLRADEILGLPAYTDVSRTPAVPDLALVIVPPDGVVDSLKACLARGVRAVIIESAGFAEMSPEGAAQQAEIVRLARASGVPVMGPNSVGTINTANGLDTSLGRLKELFLPRGEIRRGKAGYIGQTGLFTGVYLPLINEETGLGKAACLGNKCDVDESDMLAVLGEDDATGFIGLYLESVRDGRRFLDLCRAIIPRKPIVAIKGAVTGAGAHTSMTHTASVAGDDALYESLFRQAGVIRADGFTQLWDFARAFVHAPLPAGDRIGLIDLAGSGCVSAVDACARRGLRIAELSDDTKEAIAAVYPSWWRVRSPVDVWAAVEASGFENAYATILGAVLADEGVDAAVVVGAAVDWQPGLDVPALYADIARHHPGKPVYAVSPPGDPEVYLQLHRGFLARGIPHYRDEASAVAALAAARRYCLARDRARPDG